MRVDSMSAQMANYSSQFDEAFESGNFQEAFSLLVHAGICNDSITARESKNEHLNSSERAKAKVIEIASLLNGFGMNGSTGTHITHALLTGFHPVAGMAAGSFKDLKNEGVQANRILLEHAKDELTRSRDDFRSDAQKAQNATAEKTNLIKDLNSKEHQARMAIGN